jgi:phosphatidylserine decarboxylase
MLYAPWLVLGLLLIVAGWPRPVLTGAGVVVTLVGAATMLFFRDPRRRVPSEPGAVVAPADGVVTAVEHLDESPHFDGPCQRISIFLSLFNVHINRMPCDCRVLSVAYAQGRFLNAMRDAASTENESTTLRLETPHGPLTVRQISGLVARTIVCPAAVGDDYERGEKFGMIKFGSRTELYLPLEAEIVVEAKESVKAGKTIVARFSEAL